MQEVMRINGIINGIVWGPWMLALLVGTGVYLTIVLGVPQLRYFGLMFKEVFGNLGKKKEGEGAISSFAALSTALASTVERATSRESPRPFTSAVPEPSSGCSFPQYSA